MSNPINQGRVISSSPYVCHIVAVGARCDNHVVDKLDNGCEAAHNNEEPQQALHPHRVGRLEQLLRPGPQTRCAHEEHNRNQRANTVDEWEK